MCSPQIGLPSKMQDAHLDWNLEKQQINVQCKYIANVSWDIFINVFIIYLKFKCKWAFGFARFDMFVCFVFQGFSPLNLSTLCQMSVIPTFAGVEFVKHLHSLPPSSTLTWLTQGQQGGTEVAPGLPTEGSCTERSVSCPLPSVSCSPPPATPPPHFCLCQDKNTSWPRELSLI